MSLSIRAVALVAFITAFAFAETPVGAQVAQATATPTAVPVASATARPAAQATPGAAAPAAASAAPGLPSGLGALLQTPAPQSYTQFLRGAEVHPGLINLIRKDEDLYFDLAPENFGKTYIVAPSLASGLGGGTFAGRLYNPILVQFKRVGRRVLWVTPNTDFGSRDQRSLAVSTAESIIATSTILAEDSATKHVAIAPSLLLTDYLKIGEDLSRAAGGGGGGGGLLLLLGPRASFSLDTARSYYLTTKALPNNDEIGVNLTFSGTGNLQTVPDTRGTPVRVRYSIIEEPKTDSTFQMRAADDRVGYFLETQKQFGDDTQRSPFVRFIDRWDLSKGPIVFTLTNEVPKQYRDAVRRGILEWNKAFAKIGYPSAIRVDDPPADPNFDPDDIKYNPIRWITQDRASFVAATPHIADPLTGRILRATITIDGESLRSLRRGFVDSIAPARLPVTAMSPYAAFAPGSTIKAQDVKPDVVAVGIGALDPCATGECEAEEATVPDAAFAAQALGYGIRENSAQTDKFVAQYLTWVAAHESGHALGLRHNFAAASIYSLKQIHDPAFTKKNGIVTSVMSYVPANLALPGKPQAQFFQTTIGPYDYWAIEYGYKPVKSDADLRRIADRSTDPNLFFQTDEDAFGAWAVDPRITTFVLSSDPIAWHDERFRIAEHLFATLPKQYPRDGRSFYEERLAFLTILNECTRSAVQATRWVGGVYTSRSHRGQTNGKTPFAAVPRSEQRRAFDLLERHVLSSHAFNFPPGLLAQLGPDRFHGWGDQGLGARPDFPLTDFVGNVQDVVMYTLFSPANIARINDESLQAPGKTMSLQDLFEWSRSAIYDDVAAGRAIPPLHRELQRRFTDLLLTVAMLPSLAIDQLRMPYASQSLARYELQEVRAEVRRGLGSSGLDIATKAHLQELDARIVRGLNAGNMRAI